MKKINIITYCSWTSIGSILQSFALADVLKDSGYESTVWLENWNRVINQEPPKSLKDCLKCGYRILKSKKIKTAHQKRLDFIAKHMKAEYFFDYEAFKKKALENEDDIYLAGSDQIWNPDRCNPLFFLDFVKKSKCISYAASMGNTSIAPEKKEKIRNWLLAFDRISVREKACVPVLQELTSREISVHIDPTFLLEPAAWRSYEKPYPVKEPFILLYMLYWDAAYKEKIVALKQRTGLPTYAICPDFSRVYADHYLLDVSVEEFLWLFDHAKYIITSSFHGAALSILFQKRFAAVINPYSPSRIENLMETLSVPTVPIDELDRTDAFSYDKIFENIEKERQKGIEYLKEAIG